MLGKDAGEGWKVGIGVEAIEEGDWVCVDGWMDVRIINHESSTQAFLFPFFALSLPALHFAGLMITVFSSI